MVSLKQEFEFYDYLGPLAVALLFSLIILFLSFFILNFFFISKYDEPTVFERVSLYISLSKNAKCYLIIRIIPPSGPFYYRSLSIFKYLKW